jgi:hypothetical protein
MKGWLGWAWPKLEERRDIWIELLKAGAIFVIGSLLLTIGGWLSSDPLRVWRLLTGTVFVPLWLTLLFLTGCIGAVCGLYRLYRKPDYVRHYRRDTIDHIMWIWDYDDHNKLTNVLPLCTVCQTELTLTPIPATNPITPGVVLTNPDTQLDNTAIYCPTCNKSFVIRNVLQLKDRHAAPKIERRIRLGEWRTQRST